MATFPCYERGVRAGWWTADRLRETWSHSARTCLLFLEGQYQKERAKLPEFQDRVLAQCQADYLEGMIAAARWSLGQLQELGM